MATATTSSVDRAIQDILDDIKSNPRVVSLHVDKNPMGRIEPYSVTLRLPNNMLVGFYSHSLEEVRLRLSLKLDDWYNQAINQTKAYYGKG